MLDYLIISDSTGIMVLAGVATGLQHSSKSWPDLKQIIVTLYIGMIV